MANNYSYNKMLTKFKAMLSKKQRVEGFRCSAPSLLLSAHPMFDSVCI